MVFGIVMGLLASASWAGANVFVQRAGRQVGAFRALVWAQLAGIAGVLPLAVLLDVRAQAPDRGTVFWAAVAALAAVLAYPCLFHATNRGRLSVVVPIMSAWTVVAAGISLGFLGETLRPAHVLGASLVVGGVFLVSRYSQQGAAGGGGVAPAQRSPGGGGGGDGGGDGGGLWAALGGALGFGVLIPAIGRLAPATGRLGAIPLVFLLDLLLGVPIALAAGIDLRPPRGRDWLPVLGAALFETMGFVWISLGVARAPVSVVSPLAGLASAFTVLFAWLVLRERPCAQVLLGAGLACAGVLAMAR
jgi:drug/metabolite transporter (DMT)-like permease